MKTFKQTWFWQSWVLQLHQIVGYLVVDETHAHRPPRRGGGNVVNGITLPRILFFTTNFIFYEEFCWKNRANRAKNKIRGKNKSFKKSNSFEKNKIRHQKQIVRKRIKFLAKTNGAGVELEMLLMESPRWPPPSSISLLELRALFSGRTCTSWNLRLEMWWRFCFDDNFDDDFVSSEFNDWRFPFFQPERPRPCYPPARTRP